MIKLILDRERILNKVCNDRFGQKVSDEWYTLTNPFTPRDTGRTQLTAVTSPWKIGYKPINPEDTTDSSYASDIYLNTRKVRFKKTHNPFATDHWDIKAAEAGQLEELYKRLNEALKNGDF